jgi:hypothetical protein
LRNAVQVLMAHAVDYAGLFPPAGLSMQGAVRNYAQYARSGDAWMLGRFILPATRLPEFATALEANCCAERERPWMLSLLASQDRAADLTAMQDFTSGLAFADALELRAASAQEAEDLLSTYPAQITSFVECPAEALPSVLPILQRHKAHAKIRTGGVTPGAIPSMETVADFLLACADAGIACKATAGLHHALRGEYPLTYEPGAATATMHGFLNVLAAALLAQAQASRQELLAALASTCAAEFQWTPATFRWCEHRFTHSQIEAARRHGFISFGSCSFLEPVQTLAHAMKETA